MIYLSGVVIPGLDIEGIGWMLTPDMGNAPPAYGPIGGDCARFANPKKYTDERYLRWIPRLPKDRTLFVTAPDSVGNHEETLALSLPMLPRIRQLGYRAAFVAQDGWSSETTPWDEFDCLFIGGRNPFKLGQGAKAALEAKRRGKRVHMGRVNSYRRLKLAATIGCDSVDGTFLRFHPTVNTVRLRELLRRHRNNPVLIYAS